MSNQAERWQHAGEVVRARMKALGVRQAELSRRSGLSAPTVRGIMAGSPRSGEPTEDTLRAVSVALEWTPDSLGEVLAGGRATADPATVDRRLDELDRRLTEVEHELEAYVWFVRNSLSPQQLINGRQLAMVWDELHRLARDATDDEPPRTDPTPRSLEQPNGP